MKKIVLGTLITLFSSGWFYMEAAPDGLLHVFFLNVGQGDATLIRTPSGKNILVDGGPEKNVIRELDEVLPYFKNQLDAIILTHPDRDHIEGLLSVLNRYSVRGVFSTGIYKNDYFSRTFLARIRSKNIPLTVVSAQSDLEFDDGVIIDFLFPFTQIIEEREKTNDSAIVAKVVYGNTEILLTADIEERTENFLGDMKVNVDADILKVAHHGSKTSSTENFLKNVSPEWAVISLGRGNTYHHPHQSVLKRLKQLNIKTLRTDRDGRIEFIFSKNAIEGIKIRGSRI